MNPTGPGGITPGDYDPTKLSKDQRQWLFNYFGNQGEAPAGYGGQVVPGSAKDIERQTAQLATQREAFNTKAANEENAFLTKFKTEYPTILSGIESSLNLPTLREQARTKTNMLETMPEDIQTALQGSVSADELKRIQANKTNEILPDINKFLGNLQFAEEEFTRQADRSLLPYQTELDLLKDRLSREASGFNVQMEGELNLLAQKLQTQGQLTLAEYQRGTELAKLEAAKDEAKANYDITDAGDRLVVWDKSTGQLVNTFSKGKLGTLGTDGW